MKYQEIEGDLILLAKQGMFDVIAHGCNCFCNMGAGIAPQMHRDFLCNSHVWYPLEGKDYKGDVNKMGQIEYQKFFIFLNTYGNNVVYNHNVSIIENYKNPKVFAVEGKTKIVKELLNVVNAYTQFGYGNPEGDLDYEALTLCMRKINSKFKGLHIGLPQIGAGLAKGDWNRIKQIIQNELKQMDVTIVIYKP